MRKSNIISAILGIIIGASVVLIIYNRQHKDNLSNDWRKVNLLLDCIEKNYVDSLDRKKVTDAVANAALQALDPHSVYMLPEVLEESEDDLAGNFGGIGIQFNCPSDTAVVIEVISGGPAQKAGIIAGDRIVKVDTLDITKLNQNEQVKKMRGPVGTKVTIGIQRHKQLISFDLTRDKIPTFSVDASFMVNDTLGYLRLSKFSRTSYKEIVEATSKLLSKGMKSLVFDIRDNTGGFLDQALMISNLFLPKDSLIVYMEGEHRNKEMYKADGRGTLQGLDLKLLVNDGSASSSEILAGALQDNHRAKLYGRRTFGKGLVQEPFYFNDGSGIRLTVARYYSPSGRCIQKPYSDDYEYEVYNRYNTKEMYDKQYLDTEHGGIIPDVYVPIDTVSTTAFYREVYKRSTTMRFASAYFDRHKAELESINDYDELMNYLNNASLDSKFLNFAIVNDKIKPHHAEWGIEKPYIMTQVYALIARYTPLRDEAYYHIFLDIDEVFQTAIKD